MFTRRDEYFHFCGPNRRRVSIIDLPLGGDNSPTRFGLYSTKIGLGTPRKDYIVQVDTSSELLWVNCATCENCPTNIDLGMNVSFYDPKSSSIGATVTCDQDFCLEMVSPESGNAGSACRYNVTYGDDSSSSKGFFVTDTIHLKKASRDIRIARMNASITFGCGDKHSGLLASSSHAVDGILGSMVPGMQNSGVQTKDGKDMNLLGGMVLAHKLVVYDVENQTIGWTEYSCSASVKVEDKESRQQYVVKSHDLSSRVSQASASAAHFASFLLFLAVISYLPN